MGIKGLRNAVSAHMRDGHVKEMAGKTVVCDGHAWLHKAAFGCAFDIAIGKPTEKYIEYCMHLVDMLKFYGVIPIIVMDGRSLPGKSRVNCERHARRESQKSLGMELLRRGDRSGALKCFQQSIHVTAEMAHAFHVRLQREHVTCIVSPYEADAQMAYMVRKGMAQAVISEDSDMVPFGVEVILYKMDKSGSCCIFENRCLRGEEKKPFDISVLGEEQRLHMCILAGCDYLQSIPGIGIQKAFGLIRQHGDGRKAIEALRKHPKMGDKVPEGYEEGFGQAEMLFKYQWVYDLEEKKFVNMIQVPEECDAAKLEEIIGQKMTDEEAYKVCEAGTHDHRNLLPFSSSSSSSTTATSSSGPSPASSFFKPAEVAGSGARKVSGGQEQRKDANSFFKVSAKKSSSPCKMLRPKTPNTAAAAKSFSSELLAIMPDKEGEEGSFVPEDPKQLERGGELITKEVKGSGIEGEQETEHMETEDQQEKVEEGERAQSEAIEEAKDSQKEGEGGEGESNKKELLQQQEEKQAVEPSLEHGQLEADVIDLLHCEEVQRDKHNGKSPVQRRRSKGKGRQVATPPTVRKKQDVLKNLFARPGQDKASEGKASEGKASEGK
eukprot:459346-Hanusia_phi.AAC.1